MFSANENILLRQHKKQIVEYVESTLPDHVLELGVNVMAMQVSCKMPGCVPLETSIVIIFPKLSSSTNEWPLPGLPESAGGCYKTKILKPMADVTKQDVLEALPPAFAGGQRSMERLCLRTRDVMLGQITQLFGGGGDDEDDNDKDNDNDHDTYQGRKLMAQYLQQSLQDYIDRGCRPPAWGEAFAPLSTSPDVATPAAAAASRTASKQDAEIGTDTVVINEPASIASIISVASSSLSSSSPSLFASQGNIVIQRPRDDDDDLQDRLKGSSTVLPSSSSSSSLSKKPTFTSSSSHPNPVLIAPPPRLPVVTTSSSVNSITQLRYQQRAERRLMMTMGGSSASGVGSSSSSSLLAQLARQHAPGIRRAGCPCCEPDHPSNLTTADSFMRL